MLVATAGHVDHGKTLLVRSLTGVDTDRLPEEKARGLTIDLGFAYRALPGGRTLGFVDVPGHERFVRNMIAGVPAVDFALLVVAADDGPMPQTREHLAILDLLGVAGGAVAITKIDRVDGARVAAVEHEVRALLLGTPLAAAPVFAVSSITGEGIDALAGHLESAATNAAQRFAGGRFRLAVDRCFSVPGAGLVVTGAVFAGRVSIGERLRLLPGDAALRVRGIHAQNHAATEGLAGERCALNLAGAIERDAVHRGQWLVAEDGAPPSDRFDARLRVLSSEARALGHWTPVHVHHGAAAIGGRIAPLGGRALAPGEEGLVQVILDRATHLVHGDRFVLRDQSARRTIAGGVVIDPAAPRRGRSRAGRLAEVRAREAGDPAAALAATLEVATEGVDVEAFVRGRNLDPGAAARVRAAADPVLLGGRVGISRARHAALRGALLDALGAHHAAHRDSLGPEAKALLESPDLPEGRALQRAMLDDLVREGTIRRAGRALHRPDHRPVLPPADAALWARVAEHLAPDAVQPPVPHDLAALLDIEFPALEDFLSRAAARGQLVRVAANRYLDPQAVARLARVAEGLAAECPGGRFDARTFRDRAGIGRNFTIQLLEFFDAVRLTRRLGDVRAMVAAAAERFGEPG